MPKLLATLHFNTTAVAVSLHSFNLTSMDHGNIHPARRNDHQLFTASLPGVIVGIGEGMGRTGTGDLHTADGLPIVPSGWMKHNVPDFTHDPR